MSISKSVTYAADILEAWRANDSDQLNRRLANPLTPELDINEDCHEYERLELLDAIAAQISSSIASSQEAGIYFLLLRHLAKPAGTPPLVLTHVGQRLD